MAQVFAITGKLSIKRADFVKKIEDAGCTFSKTITKKVQSMCRLLLRAFFVFSSSLSASSCFLCGARAPSWGLAMDTWA
jgi:hypothetical protein